MKFIRVFLILLLILFLNLPAAALNLEVDKDLVDFTEKNKLSEKQLQDLNNPFRIKDLSTEQQNQKEEPAEAEKEGKVKIKKDSNNNKSGQQGESKDKSQEEILAKISINGVLSTSSSRTALLINYNNKTQVVEVGGTVDAFKLSSYQNKTAVFIKNGKRIEVSY